MGSLIWGLFTPAVLAYSTAGADSFSHLTAEQVVITVLIFTTLLLTGVLFHFRHVRKETRTHSELLAKYQLHVRLLGENQTDVTVFQLIRDFNGNFAFSFLSKGYEKAIGIDRKQVMRDAKLAFDHIYEEDIPKLIKCYREAYENLVPADLEIRILDARGYLKWLRISAIPCREKSDLIWVGFMQDISLRKTIEKRVLGEKENFQNLFETIDDFLLICDMNGSILHTNPAVQHKLEYPKGELETMSIFELYPKSLRDKVYKVIAIMQTETHCSCGLPIKIKSGGTIPVEMKTFKGFWENKPAIFAVARDVASRRKTESKLRESQEMLQLTMNTIPMSVFWKDKDSVYLGCNKSFCKECGFDTVEDVIGKTPFDFFDNETASKIVDQDQQVILKNEPELNFLHSYKRTGGEVGWRESNTIPLHNEHGQAVGILGMWRDVTDQNRAEERLKRTLEDMERFNQLMRGRELRTLELKDEVNALQKELGRQIKYRTTSDSF